MLGMVVGSTIGGYLPIWFGASVLSFASITRGFIGGVISVWLSRRILD